MNPSRPRGFTLIELMVAVTIVALLGAIALPGYGEVIRRAQRQDARLALMELQHELERHYLRSFTYTDRITEPRDAGGLGYRDLSRSGDYRLSVRLREDGQGYLAEAMPEAGGRQARDTQCARFTVDEKGLRTATDTGGTDTTAPCWR
jgi:type IV pilus assembly protein PilE